MNRIFSISSVLIVALILSCSTTPAKNEGIRELVEIERRWLDGVQAVENVRNSGPNFGVLVTGLESIKTDLEGVQVSDYLQGAKLNLKKSMDKHIRSIRYSLEESNEFIKLDELYKKASSRKAADELKEKLISKKVVQKIEADNEFKNYVAAKNICISIATPNSNSASMF